MNDIPKKKRNKTKKNNDNKNIAITKKYSEDTKGSLVLQPEENLDLEEENFKIAKHFEPRSLIETKNTSGDLAILPNRNQILSLANGALLSLDLDTLSVNKKFEIQNEEILSFAFNPAKNELIVLTSISMIHIFDYETEKILNHFKLNKTVGKIIKMDPTNNFFAVVTSNNSIIIYDAKHYNIEYTFTGHDGIIYDIAFNPVKDKFILYSASEDNTVRIWNILIKKCTGVLEHSSSVRHLLLTNDGSFLICGTFDNKVFIWKMSDNYSDSKNIKPKVYDIGTTFESMMYFTRNISGKNIPSLLLGSDDGEIAEFNLQNGNVGENIVNIGVKQPIVQISNFLPDKEKFIILTSEQVVAYVDGDIVERGLNKAKVSKLYPCFCQEILSVKYINPNGDFVFSSNDNVLKYYDQENNKIKMFEGHEDFIMSITVKNDIIITTSKDNSIRLWRYKYDKQFECKCICVLKGHSDTVNFADISLKKAKRIVSGCKDGSLKIWDIENVLLDEISVDSEGENSQSESNQETKVAEIVESLNSLIPHEKEVNVVKYAPNEKLIASGSYDKTIKIFSSSLELLGTIKGHKRGVMDLSFSLYAKVLLSSSTDKTIKLWNLNDYSCLNTFEGHLSSVLHIDWVYHGTHIISAGADGMIKLWNIKSSECVNTIDAHEGKIWALDVTSDNNDKIVILTGGTDAKIIQWNDVTAEKEKEIKLLQEDKLNKEDELRMMNYTGRYIDALKLSLELNHKSNFITSFAGYVDSLMTKEKDVEVEYGGDLDIIIHNRKILDHEIEEEEDITSKRFSQALESIFNNEEIKEIVENNSDKIIEMIRDNNIKLNNYFYAQILLKMLLRLTSMNKFYTKKRSEDAEISLTKKKRQRLPKNSIENLEVIKSYSEKHLERLKRQISQSYLMEYSIQKMKLI